MASYLLLDSAPKLHWIIQLMTHNKQWLKADHLGVSKEKEAVDVSVQS